MLDRRGNLEDGNSLLGGSVPNRVRLIQNDAIVVLVRTEIRLTRHFVVVRQMDRLGTRHKGALKNPFRPPLHRDIQIHCRPLELVLPLTTHSKRSDDKGLHGVTIGDQTQ